MKRLPNILSCSRIVLSVFLLFLRDRPVLFTAVYLLCGISDVMDGYSARVMQAETDLGARLDSLGDFVFFSVWVFLIWGLNGGNHGLLLHCVIIVGSIRMFNLAVTKIKFKQWSMMHTIGNKMTGLFLFFLVPVCSFIQIPPWSIVVFGAAASLSALEETMILLKADQYNANIRSIFVSDFKDSL